MFVTAGFHIPYYEMPYFVQNLTYLNFIKIQFESMILILFKDRCESTPISYNSYGINESQLSLNLYILITELIVLRLIGFILFVFKSNFNLTWNFMKSRKG